MDKKLMLFILIFFLALGAFSVSVFLITTSRQIRATQLIPSQALCITNALSVETGQSATITCVARDKNTNAVGNTECCFTASLGEFQPTCGKTDKYGTVSSDLTSTTSGISNITCTIDNNITATTSVEYY